MGCGLAPAASALAAPPWWLDWALLPKAHETVVRLQYVSNQTNTTRTDSLPQYQLFYGVTPNFDLSVRSDDIETSSPSNRGYGDTLFCAKWRFYRNHAGVQLLAGHFATLPTANSGLGGRAAAQQPFLVAAKQIGHWSVAAQLAETFPGNKALQNSTSYGLLAACKSTKRWQFGGDIYGNTPTASGANQEFGAGLGIQYCSSPELRYCFHVAHSFEGFNKVNLFCGVQVNLPAH